MSDPIIISEEIIRDDGSPRQCVQTVRETTSVDDPNNAELEQHIAARVFGWLRKAYPGHGWFVDASVQRGGVAIAIPILMGGNWVYFIKGADLTRAKVIEAGGEILERYRIPRGRFDLASFLEARAKLSVVVNPGQKVPA